MGAPILFILFCLIAAWFDLRYRRLPNVLNAAITVVGLAMAGRGGIPSWPAMPCIAGWR
jgi:Flp pilus assembly protein protease CpaA